MRALEVNLLPLPQVGDGEHQFLNADGFPASAPAPTGNRVVLETTEQLSDWHSELVDVLRALGMLFGHPDERVRQAATDLQCDATAALEAVVEQVVAGEPLEVRLRVDSLDAEDYVVALARLAAARPGICDDNDVAAPVFSSLARELSRRLVAARED